MRYALFCLLGAVGACSDPAPAPAPDAPASVATVAAPLTDARLPIAYRAALDTAPARRLDVWITPTTVLFDEGLLYAATPAAEQAKHWPVGRPTVQKVATLTRFALDAEGVARLKATFAGAATRGRGAQDVRLIADRDTPYALALDVLAEARAAGFKRWWIHARGRSTTGDFRTRRARWCTEAAESPTPCTITWALVTTTDTWLQNRADVEAACGTPPDDEARPAQALITGKRGRCRRLKHTGAQVAAAIVPPHRQRYIQGTRCAYATLAAWPTVTWKQAVEIADGLRAAGHATIAFSRAAPDEMCPAPAPAAPASVAPISQ